MLQNWSRLLNDNDLVEHFLNAIQFDHRLLPGIIEKIVDAEIGIISADLRKQNTLSGTSTRDRRYSKEFDRWDLRRKINKELLSFNILVDDNQMKLGHGGAMPKIKVKSDKEALIVIGLPASGKSSVCAKLSENYGAVIIDSDYAKRKLPEFRKHQYGAYLVHAESNEIIFGYTDPPEGVKCLFESCIEQEFNIIIPKIGNNSKSILNLSLDLKTKGYRVHLILLYLLKQKATTRAIYRYSETKRYVPLGLIFDTYGNDPIFTYFILKDKYSKHFESFGIISSDVVKGDPYICTDFVEGSPVLDYQYVDLTW